MPESLFNKVALLTKKRQVLSCEFCEISKNTFSNRTPPVAAFESYNLRSRVLK